MQVLAGPDPSSQTIGFLLRTPWLARAARKIWPKVSSANSLQWKKHSTTFNQKIRFFLNKKK
jgi:hypothetical protein